MDGWIKLHRKLIEKGWLKNPKLFTFWIYCLLKATHEPFKAKVGYQEVNLEAGQFVFGRRIASEETGLSEQEIRTCIDSLSKAQNLTIKSTNKFSIVSIINWNAYQNYENKNNQQFNQQLTNKQPHTRTIRKKNVYSPEALEVLSYLNEKTGRHYRDASKIEIRLKDGGTKEQCKQIIDRKTRDEYFLNNPKYLNPETLFRKSHWDKYLNEPDPPKVSTW